VGHPPTLKHRKTHLQNPKVGHPQALSRITDLRGTPETRMAMDEDLGHQQWAVLREDDEGVLKEIQKILTARVVGNPYETDGSFAANIAALPVGLRAMAATHWLDVSLTLDSITWHFGNFAEPQLVAETEAGLQELGLHELALCFAETKELMLPLLAKRTEADGDPNEILEAAGLEAEGAELDRRAWALDNLGPGKSVIYAAWVRYAREYPERVFEA
jgi:hypothetical protein